MKLEIRRRKVGAKELILTDENGIALPNQAQITILQEPGNLAAVNVSFHLDFNRVSFNLNGEVKES